MSSGDFYGSERSAVVDKAGELRIELVAKDGQVSVLKPSVKVQAGEVIDASVMNVKALSGFFAALWLASGALFRKAARQSVL